MRKYIIALLSMIAFSTQSVCAQEMATPDEAKAMALRAAEYVKTVGAEKAFAAFGTPGGEWHDRDLYIAVVTADGTQPLNGANTAMNGKNFWNLQDINGKFFYREVAAVEKETWVEYIWKNPVTQKPATKKAYVVNVDGYRVLSGAYEKLPESK